MNAQTQVAMRSTNPAVAFKQDLTQRADEFRAALPSHITPEKFQRTILTAVTSDPDLLSADRRSLLTACMKAAQDGLLPDKREAALVIFTSRIKDDQGGWSSAKLVQYMPMVYGLRKKMLQSGEISTLDTNVVYKREVEEGRFIFEGGTEAMLRHRPMIELTDEECADDQIVAAYSVATMKDGTKSFEVMRRGEIDKVRQVSQTGATGRTYNFGTNKGKPIEPKGPWVDWYAEMARKTVMRRHSKTLPMSGDLIDVEAQDADTYARSVQGALRQEEGGAPALPRTSEATDGALIEHQPDDSQRDFGTNERQREPEPSGRTEENDEAIARHLDAQTQHGEDYDATTGEVLPVDGGQAPAQSDADRRFAAIMSQITNAESKGDLDEADAILTREMVLLTDEQIEQIERELGSARRRLRSTT